MIHVVAHLLVVVVAVAVVVLWMKYSRNDSNRWTIDGQYQSEPHLKWDSILNFFFAIIFACIQFI